MKISIIILSFIILIIPKINNRLFLPGIMDYFSCDTQYRVKSGDTCNKIADKFEIKIGLLLWKNKNLKCNNLKIGMKLCVDNWI